MAAINQRVPNFLGGVSQQPDFIKFPGQLRTCHNAYPDVTFGLQKRPPGEFVGKLTNARTEGESEWYEILRDNDEKFLVQFQHTSGGFGSAGLGWTRTNAGNDTTEFTSNGHTITVGDHIQANIGAEDIGIVSAVTTNTFTAAVGNIDNGTSGTSDVTIKPRIRVWALTDIAAGVYHATNSWAAGTELEVNFTGGASTDFSYLQKTAGSQPYGKITINDYTIITNPTKEVTKARYTASFKDNYAFITLNEIAYNSEYVVALGATTLTATTKYRVESLKVVKSAGSGSTIADYTWQAADNTGTYNESDNGGDDDFVGIQSGLSPDESATWQTASPKSVYTGKTEFNGTGTNGTGTTAQKLNWKDVKFTVVVNGTHFVNHYDSNNPNYDTQYTGTVTLQETGFDVGADWDELYQVVNVNGQNWLVTVSSVSEYQSYTDSNAAVYRTIKNIKKGELSKDLVLGNLKTAIEEKYGTPNQVTNDDWQVGSTSGNTNGTYTNVVLKPHTSNGVTPPGTGVKATVYITGGSISSGQSSVTITDMGTYANGGYATVDDVWWIDASDGNSWLNNDVMFHLPSYLTVELAGNGLYIESSDPFGTIGVRGGLTGDSLEAFTSSAQNISKLPGTCKDGYIVKISNTEDATADDYYVKFITDTVDGLGSGIWEETVKPSTTSENVDAGFAYSTMPHALVNNRDGTFTWTALAWADSNNNNENDYTVIGDNYWVDRQCGDDNTNPMPTFVGQTITNLFFVRNRLGLISEEQVVISQPSDYFNFFVESAISASDADPIDMGASDVKPAILNYVLPIQKGVMLFSESAQFMLFTESEEFSPKTAQLKKLSSYENTNMFSPVDTGTAVMFASANTSYTKVFELILASADQPPKVVEQTRVIPEYIPNDVDRMTNSAQLGVVTLGKVGGSNLYHYKYFDGGQQREQSAWFSWSLEGTLAHQLYSSGNLYTVVKQGTEFILQRYEFVTNATADDSYTIGTGTVGLPTTISRRFEACLDNMYIPSASEKNAALGLGSPLSTVLTPYPYLSWYEINTWWMFGNALVFTPEDASVFNVGDTYTLTWSGTSNNNNTNLNGSYACTQIINNANVVFTYSQFGSGAIKDYTQQVTDGHAGSTAGTLTVGHPPVATLFGLEITLPYTIPAGSSDIKLVDLADGLTITPRYHAADKVYFDVPQYDNDGSFIDYNAIKYAIGYSYTTEIGLPTYYLSKDRGQYDVDADLRIHRLNFDLGVSGPMDFHITSPQRDTYIHEETGITLDADTMDTVPSELYKNISIPIYKKNTKFDCTIKIPAPFTATLVSASWDGNYTTKRHARQ